MTASSDSSSYWVRWSMGHAVRTAHSWASSNAPRLSATRNVIGRDGVSPRSPEGRFIGLSVPSAGAEDNPQDKSRNPSTLKHLIRRTVSR